MPAPSKRTRFRLAGLTALLVLAAVAGDEISFRIRLNRSLAAIEPDEYFLEHVKEHPRRLDRTLAGLWDTGKLAHRQAALDLIKFPGTPEQRFSPVQRFERYLLAGAGSRDLSIRTPALQLLTQYAHPRWEALAAGQLQDPDTHMRVLAMRLFRQEGITNALPLVARQLEHPDPYLTCNAVVWLQNATAIDHGMKTRWVSRRVLLPEEERASNLKKFQASLGSAKSWWSEARRTAPAYPGPVETPTPTPPTIVPLPHLVDHERKPFDLVPHEGKPILYYFFTAWKASAFSEAPDLNALHDAAHERLTIIGVALDAIPDEHNETQHSDLIPGRNEEPVSGWGGHGHHEHHDHEGGHAHEPALKFADLSKRVRERAALHGYRFPIAFDVRGSFTTELQAGEIPCFALVDSRHRLIRRFAGGRSAVSILAMLDETNESPPPNPPAGSR